MLGEVVINISNLTFPVESSSRCLIFAASAFICWMLFTLLFASTFKGYVSAHESGKLRSAWGTTIEVIMFLTLPLVGASIGVLLKDGLDEEEEAADTHGYCSLLCWSLAICLASSAVFMMLGHDKSGEGDAAHGGDVEDVREGGSGGTPSRLSSVSPSINSRVAVRVVCAGLLCVMGWADAHESEATAAITCALVLCAAKFGEGRLVPYLLRLRVHVISTPSSSADHQLEDPLGKSS